MNLPKDWIAVPCIGAWVASTYPIGPINPDPFFQVSDINYVPERNAFYIRGEKTFWFHLNMITPKPKDDLIAEFSKKKKHYQIKHQENGKLSVTCDGIVIQKDLGLTELARYVASCMEDGSLE